MTRPDGDGGDGGFLGRWARRKQEAQRARPADSLAPAGEAATPSTAPSEESVELPMPSLDSIVPGADVSAFFQAHVPESLRKAALRKLWTTDPEISSFIEMADYQWDFTNPDAIPGWGSSLPKTDVARLIGQMLDGSAETPLKPALADKARDAPLPPEKSLEDETGPVAEIRDAMPQEQPAPVSDGDDVAPQKTLAETVIYAPSRKRHGGALPT